MPYLEFCVTVLAFRMLRQWSSDFSGHKFKRCPSGIGALLALCGVPEFSVGTYMMAQYHPYYITEGIMPSSALGYRFLTRKSTYILISIKAEINDMSVFSIYLLLQKKKKKMSEPIFDPFTPTEICGNNYFAYLK